MSWDESRDDREEYAKALGMEWLAVPHEARSLADELTLRYDVKAIPTLIILEVSPDGSDARVLSSEGRAEVESRHLHSTEWLDRVLPPAAKGGGAPGWFSRF